MNTKIFTIVHSNFLFILTNENLMYTGLFLDPSINDRILAYGLSCKKSYMILNILQITLKNQRMIEFVQTDNYIYHLKLVPVYILK